MFRKFIVVAIAATVLPAAANAQAFQNGGFEFGTAPGSFSTVGAGSGAITGWTVGGAGVDYIGSYWNAGEGSRSIDLSGNGAGSIAQTFDTILHQAYSVTFLLAGNPDGAPVVKNIDVGATGNATASYTLDSSGTGRNAMGWTSYTYNFVAAGTSTTLSFASRDSSPYGAALDGVSVTAVPEPAVWGMMIGGFGLAGMALRRRPAVRFARG
ncbi:choice-of-anchor C family protein [Sphingomonas sp. dw_22]|uniref:choice-of-anchor C family PEP-CTERM protein n=1 Tax=Sphingomonas sp. dw_22 TaxID=2721175 RepID=UPI002116A9B1|nr:choice-of-anchor C family protein [Sphingomonas sp. dw_22]